MRLSQSEFARVVQEAVRSLTPELRRRMENVSIEILPLPAGAVLREMQQEGIEDPQELLGYYSGVPLTEKSVETPFEWPERIYVFQHNLEDMCRSRQELRDEIRITVLHELAHHFGMDEDDLEELGYD